MLRSLKSLERYKVTATDGDIGTVGDFFFDDARWVIRYLIVKTGGFFEGERDVLISPLSFRDVKAEDRRFALSLTRDKIKNSPTIDTDKPVSRQHEEDYYGYYGYPFYWGPAGVLGMSTYPIMPLAAAEATTPPPEQKGDSHLRSVREVQGYSVRASDGALGHVKDLIVDDASWTLRYLVIDTSNWWFGKEVLIAPQWTNSISWDLRQFDVAMTQEAIKAGPEWDPKSAVDRDYEAKLHRHHGRAGYWGPGSQPPQNK